MGIYIMLILLELNDLKIEFTQNELIDLGLGIAEKRYTQEDVLIWIESHLAY